MMSRLEHDLDLDIDVQDERWQTLPDIEQLCHTCIQCALKVAPVHKAVDVSVVLASDSFVHTLNQTYRGVDKPTNVLSFPFGEVPEDIVPLPLGDVVLAYETCLREADEQGKPLIHHVSHLLIHGVLHLMGFDHLHETDAEQMENKEREALKLLNIPDPYLDPV